MMADNVFLMHKIEVVNRKDMIVQGVIKVVSYDEHNISLETDFGKIIITGTDLLAGEINSKEGILKLTGDIQSIQYKVNKIKEKGIKGFLFK